MELYLQFGHGMKAMSSDLVARWGGGSVILSPRDLKPQQLVTTAKEIGSLAGGKVFIDPQFYLPNCDHEKLTSHEYWPNEYSTGTFWSGEHLSDLLGKLVALNEEAAASAIILPGVYAKDVDDRWLAQQQAIAVQALKLGSSLPLYSTVALSAEATRSADQIHEIIEAAPGWGVAGIYLVCEHPRGEYLVPDPIYVANVLDLIAGLRLRGLAVVLGYCNHQWLISACSGVTAIASGTWMNVRMFPPEKFQPADDEPKNKSVWFYSPLALSEYKLPFLDVAKRAGLLESMRAPARYGSEMQDVLFAGADPSTVDFGERLAFHHYLHCMNIQVGAGKKASYDETLAHHRSTLDDARKLLERLRSKGVVGQKREFGEAIDANESALQLLDEARGHQLRRKWTSLIS